MISRYITILHKSWIAKKKDRRQDPCTCLLNDSKPVLHSMHKNLATLPLETSALSNRKTQQRAAWSTVCSYKCQHSICQQYSRVAKLNDVLENIHVLCMWLMRTHDHGKAEHVRYMHIYACSTSARPRCRSSSHTVTSKPFVMRFIAMPLPMMPMPMNPYVTIVKGCLSVGTTVQYFRHTITNSKRHDCFKISNIWRLNSNI